MKQSLFTMEHARQLTADTYELVLSGDTSAITAPGLSPSATGRRTPCCSWSGWWAKAPMT